MGGGLMAGNAFNLHLLRGREQRQQENDDGQYYGPGLFHLRSPSIDQPADQGRVRELSGGGGAESSVSRAMGADWVAAAKLHTTFCTIFVWEGEAFFPEPGQGAREGCAGIRKKTRRGGKFAGERGN